MHGPMNIKLQAEYRLSFVVHSVGVSVRDEVYRMCWSERKGRWAKHLDLKQRQ
jgi:hypothetical protein